MEKLKLNLDGKEVIIEADDKFSKGIYVANKSNTAEKNARKLNITFDDAQPDNVLQHKLTKIGNWAFLTSKAASSYGQFIFMPSANPDDFAELLEGRDETFKQLLIQAYNLSRLDMNNLDLLSELSIRKS